MSIFSKVTLERLISFMEKWRDIEGKDEKNEKDNLEKKKSKEKVNERVWLMESD